MTDLLERALAFLAAHPDSSSRVIAAGIGERDDRAVFAVLDNAAYKGRCQRWRKANGPWLWEIPNDAACWDVEPVTDESEAGQ